MKRNAFTRVLSAFLAFVMVFLMIPASVFSALADAIQNVAVNRRQDMTCVLIYNAEQFNAIRENLGGTYILMNDIDLSGYTNWEPIGSVDEPFTGNLLASGYTVKGMKITTLPKAASDGFVYVGLFGYVKGMIRDLRLEGEITADVSGKNAYVGTIAAYNDGAVLNCYDGVTYKDYVLGDETISDGIYPLDTMSKSVLTMGNNGVVVLRGSGVTYAGYRLTIPNTLTSAVYIFLQNVKLTDFALDAGEFAHDIYIISQGTSNSITAKSDTVAIKAPNANVIVLGDAPLTVSGGNGSKGNDGTAEKKDGDPGKAGKSAVEAKTLTVSMDCEEPLKLYGGNGGNGGVGARGTNYSYDVAASSDENGAKGPDGGDGGQGGRGGDGAPAIAASSVYAYSECFATSGNGADGGQGGRGGDGAKGNTGTAGKGSAWPPSNKDGGQGGRGGNGGFAGKGGDGGNTVAAIQADAVFGEATSYIGIVGSGGAGNNGGYRGNGGNGGSAGGWYSGAGDSGAVGTYDRTNVWSDPGISGSSPVAWKAQFVQYGKQYSLYSSSDITYGEAQAQATARGEQLVSINSAEEQGIVANLQALAGDQHLWIGLTRKAVHENEANIDLWIWADGTEFLVNAGDVYSNWFEGEPNNAGENEWYAHLSNNGFWNDNSGDARLYGYITERTLGGEILTPTEPIKQFFRYLTLNALSTRAKDAEIATNYPTDYHVKTTPYNNAYYLGTATNPYAVLVAAADQSINICLVHEDTEVIYFGAFGSCTKLTAIKLPENIRVVGPRAFYGCTKLVQVIAYNGLSEIARYAFDGCLLLSDFQWAENECIKKADAEYVRIGQSAFQNCSSLTDVALPEWLTEIGAFAFSGAKHLKQIIVPAGIAVIGQNTFAGCEKLEKVTFAKDSKLTEIGSGAFVNCVALTGIEFPETLNRIGGHAFEGNTSLRGIFIPAQVSQIDDKAFYACPAVESIVVDANNATYHSNDSNCLVETASGKLLVGCKNSDIRKSQATYVGAEVFMDLIFTQPIEIPAYVTLEQNAFVRCSGEIIFTEFVAEVPAPVENEKPEQTSDREAKQLAWDAYETKYTGVLQDCDNLIIYAYRDLGELWEGKDSKFDPTFNRVCDDGQCGDARYVLIKTNDRYEDKSLGVLLCYGDGKLGSFSAKGSGSYHKYTADKLGICIKEAIVSNGIDTIGKKSFVDFEFLVSIRFGKDVQVVEENAIYNNTPLSSIFFEGDCPQIHKDAFRLIKEEVDEDGNPIVVSNDSHLKIAYDIDTHGWTYNGKPYQSFVHGEGLSTLEYVDGTTYLVTTDANLTPINRANTDRYGIIYELQYKPEDTDKLDPIAAVIKDYNPQTSQERDIVVPLKILAGTDVIPVIGIQSNAFADVTDVTNITITTPTAAKPNDGIKAIASRAFAGCTAQVYFVGDYYVEIDEKKTYVDVAADAFDATAYMVANQNAIGWSFENNATFGGAKVYASSMLNGNQDQNGIYYTVDLAQKTAIVGKKSSGTEENAYNTSNATLAKVVIPSFVTYNDRLYKVVGFDRYAFYGNKLATSIEFGAFVGDGQSEELPAIWDCTFRNTEHLKSISVHQDNVNYRTVEGVLYGNPLVPQEDERIFTRLLKYPEAKSGSFSFPTGNEYRITVIENYAFAGNDFLTEIDLSTVNVIGSHAFWNCTMLSRLNGNYQLNGVGDSAFENTSITDFRFGEALATIGVRAFYGSKLSGDIQLNHNLISIGDGAFGRCTAIRSFAFLDYSNPDRSHVLNSNVTASYRLDFASVDEKGNAIYASLFDCRTTGRPVLLQFAPLFEIPLSGEYQEAIYDMSADDVLVPYAIATEAFWGARYLQKLILNDRTALVGSQAFANCPKLEYVKLGADYYGSSTSEAYGLYSYNLFVDSPSLDYIEVSAQNPHFSNDSNGVLYSKEKDVLYCYPAGIQRVSYQVPATVTKLYDSAFYGNTNLKQVVIGTTQPLSIGSRAFGNCSSLNAVYYVSETVPTVGEKIYDNTPVTLYTRFKSEFGNAVTDAWYGYAAEGVSWCERPIGSYEVITEVPNDMVETNDYLLYVKGTDGSALTDVYFIITVYTLASDYSGGEDEFMALVPHKFYLYADENGTINFSTMVAEGLQGIKTIRPFIHVYAQKEGYYTYDQDMYIDLDMLISYLTLTQEPDVFGVSCEKKDINSQTADLNLALYRETYNYTVQTDAGTSDSQRTSYEDVVIKVLGFWDPVCTDPVFSLIQCDRVLDAKAVVDGNGCTFTVSAGQLVKDAPIEARVRVRNGNGYLECRKVLNINVIDLELDERNVNFDFGANISLADGPDLFKQLFGSAQFEIEFSDDVKFKTEINESQVILTLTAEYSSPSQKNNPKKGYEENLKPYGKGSYFYQYFDGFFTYNIRFVQSEADHYYYYRVYVYRGLPGMEYGDSIIEAYGTVNLSPFEAKLVGRDRVRARALMIFGTTRKAIIDTITGKWEETFDGTLDLNKLFEDGLPSDWNLKDLMEDYKPPKDAFVDMSKSGNSQVSNSHKFDASIEGQLVFEYARGEGIHLASGSVKGEVKYTFKHNSQYVVWVIPVTLEIEVTVSGEVNLKLRFDSEAAPVQLEELSIKLAAEIKASVGVGCSVASVGIYGSIGTVVIFDILPETDVRSWEIHGEIGAYVKILWYKKEFPIWSGQYYIIGQPEQKARLATFKAARAGMYLANTYQYSADCEENPTIIVSGDDYYKLYFTSMTGAGYDPYNSIKLVWSKWTNGAWSAPVVLDSAAGELANNGTGESVWTSYSDAAYTVLQENGKVYIAYTQQTKLFTAETVNDTTAGAEGLSMKWIELPAGGFEALRGTEAQTVVDGNQHSSYKYAQQIGVANGQPLLVWAENSDNNIFGVSPDNYYDQANEESHVYETVANSIWTATYNGSEWSSPVCIKSGLSALVDLAVDGQDIYYVMDADGDLTDGSDCMLVCLKDSNAQNAAVIGAASSVEVQNGCVMYYSLDEADEGLRMIDGVDQRLPDVTTMLKDSYLALTDENGTVNALLYPENVSWEEFGNTCSRTVIKGMFLEGNVWGAPVTVYDPEAAGCYVSSFDAAYLGEDLVLALQVCNEDGATLDSVLVQKDLDEVDFEYTYRIDYRKQQIILTVTNKSAKSATFTVKNVSKQIGGGMTDEIIISGSIASTSVSITAQRDEEHSKTVSLADTISTAYADLLPYAKQMVIGESNSLLIAVRNRGNVASTNGTKLYVVSGALGEEFFVNGFIDPTKIDSAEGKTALQLLRDRAVHVIDVEELAAGDLAYYELMLDDSMLAGGNGVISVYVEDCGSDEIRAFTPSAEPNACLDNNLMAIYLSEISQTADDTIEPAVKEENKLQSNVDSFQKYPADALSPSPDVILTPKEGATPIEWNTNVELRLNGERLDERFYTTEWRDRALVSITLLSAQLNTLEAKEYTVDVLVDDQTVGSVKLLILSEKSVETETRYLYQWLDGEELLKAWFGTETEVGDAYPGDPQKLGYTFLGWSNTWYNPPLLDGDGNVITDESGNPIPNESVRCYTARYEKTDVTSYRVTWVISSVLKVTQSVESGKIPVAPERLYLGRIIRGWDVNGDGIADEMTAIASDMTYTALFDPSRYEFDVQGVPSAGTMLEADLSAIPFYTDSTRMAKLKLQWYADGVAVAGATGTTFYLDALDVNKEIWLVANDDEWIGTSLTYVIAKHEHLMFYYAYQAPTCDYAGNVEYWYCSACNKCYSDADCTEVIDAADTVIPALGHHYLATVTAPTCLSNGYTTHVCEYCQHVYVDTKVNANGHTLGGWFEITAPTCTDQGMERRNCADCEYYELQAIAKLGHAFETTWTVDKAATCTDVGYESHHCTRKGCDAIDGQREIAKLSHAIGEWVETKTPNCVEDGMKRRDCADCDYYEFEVLPKLGHAFETTWTVDKAATCTDVGYESHHCTRKDCDAIDGQREIAKLSHAIGEWVETKTPNCVEDGMKRRDCADCDYYEFEVLPKLGHAFEATWTVDKAATCTNVGYESHHCTRCDAIGEQREIAKVEHQYDGGKVTLAPSASMFGIKTYTCQSCAHAYTEQMPKLAPSVVEQSATVWEEWTNEGTILFRSNASYEDFVEVRLNGEILPADCYTLKEGSIVVELAPAYVGSLKNGDYKLEIVSETGVAESFFSVQKNPVKNPWVLAPVISVLSAGALATAVWFVFFKKKLFTLSFQKNF